MVPLSNIADIGAPGALNLKESYTFRDGFKRVFQTVQSNVSLMGSSYKQLIQINDTRFQRDQCSFLPYTTPYFGLQNYTYQVQKEYYAALYPGEGYTSYSKSTTDGNRGRIDYAPGKSQVGQDRGTVTRPIINSSGQVRIWDIDANGKPVSTTTYNANELFGEEVIAPVAAGNNNIHSPSSRVFTDKDGRLILKMVADSSASYVSGGVQKTIKTFQSTYYVYDEMGQLRYTLPPRAVQLIEQNGWVVTTTVLDNLCFQYRYDGRGRLSEQRFPGEKGFTGLVYDNRQRLVMTQAPSDKVKSQFQLTYYDKLNRVVGTALMINSSTPVDWQGAFDYPPVVIPPNDPRYYMGYSQETGLPPDGAISGHTMLSYNYYDNYEVADPGSANYTNYNAQLNFGPDLQSTPGSESPTRSLRTRGQLTGSKVKIFRSPSGVIISTGDWSLGHNYYDDKGRLINTLKLDLSNQGGQIHYHYSGIQYDFLNRPLVSKSIFQNLYASYTVYTELTKNEYQLGTGVLLKTSHKMGTAPWNIIAQYQYDSLGRVQRKVLGNYGEVQDFSYNIRGQLMGINETYALSGDKGGESRTFGEALRYDYGFSVPQYNGKIAGIVWRGSNTSRNHAYGYDYDLSGRLKNAEYRTSSQTFGIRRTWIIR